MARAVSHSERRESSFCPSGWCYLIELIRHDLKSGLGPRSVLDWLRKLAEGIASGESGVALDATFRRELVSLAELAQQDLSRA